MKLSVPISVVAAAQQAAAFVPQYSSSSRHMSIKRIQHDAPTLAPTLKSPPSWQLCMSDQPPDEDGADLAAQFFRAVSDRDISIEGDEIDFADAEDEELDGGYPLSPGENESVELDDDDDAILREYDVSSEGSLTNEQIYDEVKDRVFESAGAFVELNSGPDEGLGEEGGPKVYQAPTNVPDTGLTAGEVVELGECEF